MVTTHQVTVESTCECFIPKDNPDYVVLMARTLYGQTWWGEQWLNALAHIDYGNRLPRGKTYANKGAVKELAIKGNTVRAGVRGTRPTPYKVKVKVPAFAFQTVEP